MKVCSSHSMCNGINVNIYTIPIPTQSALFAKIWQGHAVPCDRYPASCCAVTQYQVTKSWRLFFWCKWMRTWWCLGNLAWLQPSPISRYPWVVFCLLNPFDALSLAFFQKTVDVASPRSLCNCRRKGTGKTVQCSSPSLSLSLSLLLFDLKLVSAVQQRLFRNRMTRKATRQHWKV